MNILVELFILDIYIITNDGHIGNITCFFYANSYTLAKVRISSITYTIFSIIKRTTFIFDAHCTEVTTVYMCIYRP